MSSANTSGKVSLVIEPDSISANLSVIISLIVSCRPIYISPNTDEVGNSITSPSASSIVASWLLNLISVPSIDPIFICSSQYTVPISLILLLMAMHRAFPG